MYTSWTWRAQSARWVLLGCWALAAGCGDVPNPGSELESTKRNTSNEGDGAIVAFDEDEPAPRAAAAPVGPGRDTGGRRPDAALESGVAVASEAGVSRTDAGSVAPDAELARPDAGPGDASILTPPDSACPARSLKASSDGVSPLVISSDEELERLRGVTRLLGSLTLRGTVTGLGPLSCLSEVVDTLTVQEAHQLTELSLPLQRVARLELIDNRVLSRVELAALRSVLVTSFERLPALSLLSLSALTSHPDKLSVEDCGASASSLRLDFGALREVAHGLKLVQLPSLVDLSGFQQLTRVGGQLYVDMMSPTLGARVRLAQVALPALETVGSAIFVSGDGIRSIELPVLRQVGVAIPNGVAYSMYLDNMQDLSRVDLGRLTYAPAQVFIGGSGAASSALDLNFRSLTGVEDRFQLSRLPTLRSLAGFPALRPTDGGLVHVIETGSRCVRSPRSWSACSPARAVWMGARPAATRRSRRERLLSLAARGAIVAQDRTCAPLCARSLG